MRDTYDRFMQCDWPDIAKKELNRLIEPGEDIYLDFITRGRAEFVSNQPQGETIPLLLVQLYSINTVKVVSKDRMQAVVDSLHGTLSDKLAEIFDDFIFVLIVIGDVETFDGSEAVVVRF